MQGLVRRNSVIAVTFAAAALTAAAAIAATQPAPAVSAAALLGDDVKGDNWTVDPVVKSDGFVRIFAVTTPYGNFQVNGQRRMTQRIHELRALKTLESMSRSDEFGKALARAGMAPIKFGRDLILDPVETTGNVVSGIGKMFSNIGAGVSGKGGGRDSALGGITGHNAAVRELAFRLGVDPYTDFTPLRQALDDMGSAMNAGGLTVSAAIMAIPGGAGVAVSATATSADFASSVHSRTSADIAALVRTKLAARGVNDATIQKFIDNKSYSPADLWSIADALEKLGATNSQIYVERAAAAGSVDVAKFHRWRAEYLAANSDRYGKLTEFVAAGDIAVNMNAKGHIVAAFPFDLVAWTDTVQEAITLLTGAVKQSHPTTERYFSSTGPYSTMAEQQLKALGWKLLRE
jgi:hypothetical protein